MAFLRSIQMPSCAFTSDLISGGTWDYQCGQAAVRDSLIAHEQVSHPVASVRAHDDEVALVLGRILDRFGCRAGQDLGRDVAMTACRRSSGELAANVGQDLGAHVGRHRHAHLE